METTQKFKFHVIKERPQSNNLPVVPSPAELGGIVLYHIYIFNNPDLKETSLSTLAKSIGIANTNDFVQFFIDLER